MQQSRVVHGLSPVYIIRGCKCFARQLELWTTAVHVLHTNLALVSHHQLGGTAATDTAFADERALWTRQTQDGVSVRRLPYFFGRFGVAVDVER